MNCHLLKCIVEKFMPHGDEEQKQMKSYIAELEHFASATPIHKYIDVCQVLATAPKSKKENLVPVDMYTPSPELFSCLKIKIELIAQHDKLSYVLKLQGHLMKHFSLYHPTLLLGSVTRGSVVIAWHFPVVETKHILPTAVSSSAFYKEHNIMQVTLDGDLVYGDAMTATAHGQQEVGRYNN